MEKTLRAIKRQMARSPSTLMPNEVIICPSYLHTNPYCIHSTKHEQWQQLCNYMHTTNSNQQKCSVYDILQHTTYTASQLWNEARLKHLEINIQPLQSQTSSSALTYFDNVRNQWAELTVVCGVSGEPITIFRACETPELTVQDICITIEASCCGVWTPSSPRTSEWSFVLHDSGQQSVINTKTQMQDKWWSVERFSYHQHNYQTICKLQVFAMEYDEEIQHEFDLALNRQHYAQQLQNSERQRLREEQDKEYYQSLEMDAEKNPGISVCADACLTELTQQEEHTEDCDNTEKPMNIQQLREARCRFFL